MKLVHRKISMIFNNYDSEHLFSVLKRTVPLKRFFWIPKTYVFIETYKTVHIIFTSSLTSYFMIFWLLTFVLDAQKNRLIDTVLLRTHNVCFILNQIDMTINICVWCSKEPSHWHNSFECPQHMFSAMEFHILDTSHFSHTSRHEATGPFIFQIAAISPI